MNILLNVNCIQTELKLLNSSQQIFCGGLKFGPHNVCFIQNIYEMYFFGIHIFYILLCLFFFSKLQNVFIKYLAKVIKKT